MAYRNSLLNRLNIVHGRKILTIIIIAIHFILICGAVIFIFLIHNMRLIFVGLNDDIILQAWNVNWGTKHMMIQAEDENLTFSCLTAECKVSWLQDCKYG